MGLRYADQGSIDALIQLFATIFDGNVTLAWNSSSDDTQTTPIKSSGRSASTLGLTLLNVVAEKMSDKFSFDETTPWNFNAGIGTMIMLLATSIADTARWDATENAFGGDVTSNGSNAATWHIRWPWFIWPAAMEACAILRLALTIFETRRRKFPVWKTNAMVIMFRGLYEPDGMLAPGVTNISEMERFAAKQRVKLAMNAQGCRMESVEDDVPALS